MSGKEVIAGKFLTSAAALEYVSRHRDQEQASQNSVEERPFTVARRDDKRLGASAPEEPRPGRPRHTNLQHTEPASPWSKRREREVVELKDGPIPGEELHVIAEDSSLSERRADEAERELMEWKKLKFMEQHIGADFDGLIVSVTKYGFFVELTELFVEGLVPVTTLEDDHYTFRENTRQIIGERTRKTFSIGDRVQVIVDRIDHMQRKIQFALLQERPAKAKKPTSPKGRAKAKARKQSRKTR
jgi:ribonuclease R